MFKYVRPLFRFLVKQTSSLLLKDPKEYLKHIRDTFPKEDQVLLDDPVISKSLITHLSEAY